MEASDLRQSWRFRHTLNKPEGTTKARDSKKMLTYDVRSRNVYENKGNNDKMPDEKSAINSRYRRKFRVWGGQFALNCILGTVWKSVN